MMIYYSFEVFKQLPFRMGGLLSAYKQKKLVLTPFCTQIKLRAGDQMLKSKNSCGSKCILFLSLLYNIGYNLQYEERIILLRRA